MSMLIQNKGKSLASNGFFKTAYSKVKSALLVAATTLCIYTPDLLARGVRLGHVRSGPLQKIGKFFQQIVDFLGGTGTMFVIFLSLVSGIALWIFMPKQGSAALGWVFRACIGGIVLFTLGTVLTWLQHF